MVVAVGVITGLCKVEEEPSDPVHDHVVALLELSLKVTVPPTHIGPLLPGPDDVGIGLTVTMVVLIANGLQPGLLTDNEYADVTVGVAVGFCTVADDRLTPLHK